MRHRKADKKFGRNPGQRKALLKSLVRALFKYKAVTTTRPKASEARRWAEKMITFAKKGDLHSRRRVLRFIPDKDIVKQLFDEIAPRFSDRQGGYTRITKLGYRRGDAAEMARLEILEG